MRKPRPCLHYIEADLGKYAVAGQLWISTAASELVREAELITKAEAEMDTFE